MAKKNEIINEETANKATFDFQSDIETSLATSSNNLGVVTEWTKEVVNSKGETKVVSYTDKAIVSNLTAIDILLSMREKTSLGICYELSVCASNKEKMGYRSIGEAGKELFGFANQTATQYARVGRLFINKVETEKGINYVFKDEFKGATVTNLVQILSLVDDKSDEPLETIYDAIRNDKLHISGTLANVKKEVKEIAGKTGDSDKVVDAKAKVVESVKESIFDAFTTILTEIEKLIDEEKKEKATEAIGILQSIFTEKPEATD